MLRRISEHVKKQNWLAVAIEFLIIAVGVFMGLQVQEWNQQRIDRNKEQAYLERLSADFAVIDDDLKHCLSVYRNSVDAIRIVSRVVENHVGEVVTPAADRDAFASALVGMTAGPIPAGRSATFLEMLSTGDLSILNDATVRDALIAYDERAQVSRESWRSLREESIAYLSPLYENVKLDIELDAKRVSSIRDYDLAAMSGDPKFHSMLNVLAGHKGNNYELCLVQLDLVDKVQQSLAQQQ